jgi:MinD-like ATPase involved in chromosome partitioning or flagellar assembly
MVDDSGFVPHQPRRSFLTAQVAEEPPTQGVPGFLNKLGAGKLLHLHPTAAERREREDIAQVSQNWPGPCTIAIVNGKGGAGKTPTTALLSAVFARNGGAGVLAWDNNQTRGTLGWRTEAGPHDSTLLDLLPEINGLLNGYSQAADFARFVHHQTHDHYDVLRSQPMALAQEQRLTGADVDAIWTVAAKYYRLIFIDSGNDESDPLWLEMIDHTDQLVVATTTRDDHAEAAALLIEALSQRDPHSRELAQQAVTVVTQADAKAKKHDVEQVVNNFRHLVPQVVSIPYDPAMVDGILSFDSLRHETQRAWLSAGAAVAHGLGTVA